MADFPFDKSVISISNYNETLPDRTIRSNMDKGPAKIRRSTVCATYEINFTMFLTSEQFEVFRNFYFENDAYVFNFRHPDTNQVLRVRFANTPSRDYDSYKWIVGVKLEVLP